MGDGLGGSSSGEGTQSSVGEHVNVGCTNVETMLSLGCGDGVG